MYSKKNFQKYFMKKLEGSWIQILNLCKNEKELLWESQKKFLENYWKNCRICTWKKLMEVSEEEKEIEEALKHRKQIFQNELFEFR